jgi:hypothetical protein
MEKSKITVLEIQYLIKAFFLHPHLAQREFIFLIVSSPKGTNLLHEGTTPIT